MIFKINNSLYALLSSEVKELLREIPVFTIPFVPKYIDGVLNRYGDPYAVIDIATLLDLESQSTALFLVLQNESRTCFKITEVEDFYSVNSSEIRSFSEKDSNIYFIGSFLLNDKEVLILDSEAIISKVEKDFESY